MATYEEYREKILEKNEAFTTFFYLDTRGFLTAGLGYLFVRNASGDAGPSVIKQAVDELQVVGITLTAGQLGALNGVCDAIRRMPVTYTYPSIGRLSDFNQTAYGQALAQFVTLKAASTTTGHATTWQVTQAISDGQMVAVEDLFDDDAAHVQYLGAMVKPYEGGIDQALSKDNVTLTDSQRVGLISVAWNRPKSVIDVVDGLSQGVDRDQMRTIVAANRPVSPARVDGETDLIMQVTTAEDVFGN